MVEDPTGDVAPPREHRASICIAAALLVIALSLGTFLATGASSSVSGGWFAYAPTGDVPVEDVLPAVEALAWRGPALAVGAALAGAVLVIGIRARLRHRPVPLTVFALLALAAVPAILTETITASLPGLVFIG
ncbi:hypothetical protein ACT3TZ_10480 [Brachybacterium sp. AOP25-B2-12]|uniref:hypothetical protein n=1 Tax=Brachybacterium sp. AOP25-B2-12 TaxID=3457710 RepID=UPI0040345BF9